MLKLLVIEEMLYISIIFNNILQPPRKINGQELGGGFPDLGAGIQIGVTG
jgi:hypothetical protein